MSKPKELWISLGEKEHVIWPYHPRNEHFNYHVIEHSAYKELEVRLQKAIEALNKARMAALCNNLLWLEKQIMGTLKELGELDETD